MGFNYLGGKRAIRDDDPHFGPFYQSGNVGWNGFLKRFVARSARVTSFERIVKREMVAGEKRLLFLNGSWLCFPIDVREQRPKTILRMGIVKAFFSRPRRRKTAENQDFAISGNKGSKGMLHEFEKPFSRRALVYLALSTGFVSSFGASTGFSSGFASSEAK